MSEETFVAIVGPMFSSKTTSLLHQIKRKIRQGKKCAIFKPKLDDRYKQNYVVSHDGVEISAIPIETGDDIIEYVAQNDVDVVAVDEAFMIPGIAAALTAVYLMRIDVIVASIDISYSGKILPEIDKILVWATEIIKCTAVCEVCKKDARFTYKKTIVENEPDITVGGSEIYEPRCKYHFPFSSHLGFNLDELRREHSQKKL